MRRSSCAIPAPSAPGSTSWTRWPGTSLLARKLDEEGEPFASAWNFGPEDADARPVDWVVRRFCEQWGEGAAYGIDRGEHPHEAHHLKLDISKAKNCPRMAPPLGPSLRHRPRRGVDPVLPGRRGRA